MKKGSILLLVSYFIILGLLPLHNTAVTTVSVQPTLIIGGTQGSANGEFNEPDSVYVDGDGLIFAGDTDNLRVQVFNSEGKYIREFTGFTPATGGAVGNEVQGIGELSNGTIVVVEKAGNLFSFDKTTGKMTSKLNLKTLNSDNEWDTQGLVVDKETDYIYITNQPKQKILVIASNGSLIKEISVITNTGTSPTPENMALDKKRGRIYVSQEGFQTIDYFAFNGSFLGSFGKGIPATNFEGLAVDPLGNILAVDETGSPRIVIFDPDKFIATYAFGGTATGSNPGEFSSPDGLAYDYANNQVLIADQGNFRVQVFDYISILKTSGIYSDTAAPTVSDVGDVSLDEGSTEVLTWNVKDAVFSGSYEITKDGSSVGTGTFDADGSDVSYTLKDLTVGTYEFKLTATDAFGNSASDIVTVTVSGVDKESTTKDDTPFPFIWGTIFVAVMIYSKKQKNKI